MAANTRITDLEIADLSKKKDDESPLDERKGMLIELAQLGQDEESRKITLEELKNELIGSMYPVGSIIHTTAAIIENGKIVPVNPGSEDMIGYGEWALYGDKPTALFGVKDNDSDFSLSSTPRGNLPTSAQNVGHLDKKLDWGYTTLTKQNLAIHTHSTRDNDDKTKAKSQWGVYVYDKNGDIKKNNDGSDQIESITALELSIRPSYGLLSEHKYVKDQIIALRNLDVTTTDITLGVQNNRGNPYTDKIKITDEVKKKLNAKIGKDGLYQVKTEQMAFVQYGDSNHPTKWYIFMEVPEMKSPSKPSDGTENKNKWVEAYTEARGIGENIPVLGTNRGEIFKPAETSDGKINWSNKDADKVKKSYPYYNPIAAPQTLNGKVRIKDTTAQSGYKDITTFTYGDYVTFVEEDGTISKYVYVRDNEIRTERYPTGNTKKKSSGGGSGSGGTNAGADDNQNFGNYKNPYNGYADAASYLDNLKKKGTQYVKDIPETVFQDTSTDTTVAFTADAEDIKDANGGQDPSAADLKDPSLIQKIIDAGKKLTTTIKNTATGKDKTGKSKTGTTTTTVNKIKYKTVGKWIKFIDAHQCAYLGRTTTNIQTSNKHLSTIDIIYRNHYLSDIQQVFQNKTKTVAHTGDIAAYGAPGGEYIFKPDDHEYTTYKDIDTDIVQYSYNKTPNQKYWYSEDTGFDIMSNCKDKTTAEDGTNKDMLFSEPLAVKVFDQFATYKKDAMCAHDKKVYIAKNNLSPAPWDASKWTLYSGDAYYAEDLDDKNKKKQGISQISLAKNGGDHKWATGLVMQPTSSNETGTGEPGDNNPVPFSTHTSLGYGFIMWPNNGFTTLDLDVIMEHQNEVVENPGDGNVASLRAALVNAFKRRQAVQHKISGKVSTDLYPEYPLSDKVLWQMNDYSTDADGQLTNWNEHTVIDAEYVNGPVRSHARTKINIMPEYVTAYRWVRIS